MGSTVGLATQTDLCLKKKREVQNEEREGGRGTGRVTAECLGLARTIHLKVYTVYLRCFKHENYHTYGQMRCKYTVLANAMSNAAAWPVWKFAYSV
jgi:hypothetical protein